MIQVRKSQIVDEGRFARKVADHARELTEWAAHMAKVGVDQEYVAFPRPQADRFVESVIVESDGTFTSNYEVLDDSPSVEQVLLAKKSALFSRVTDMERLAAQAVFPAGRRRLAQMRATDIAAKDSEVKAEFLRAADMQWKKLFEEATKKNSGVAPSRVAAKIGPMPTEDDADQHVSQKRDPADADFLTKHEDRARRLEAISHHGAVLQDQIEDLTIDNVDDWKPEPFPT